MEEIKIGENGNFTVLNKKYIIPVGIGLVGLVILIIAVKIFFPANKELVEFKEASVSGQIADAVIKVDVSGAVEKPGVYDLPLESRIQEALFAAGGLSLEADRDWVAKNLNLAAKAADGAKIYIPAKNETKIVSDAQTNTLGVVSDTSNQIININTGSKLELDSLPGVGEVISQKIIDSRPYTDKQELLTKKVVNKSTFEKIKDKISIY